MKYESSARNLKSILLLLFSFCLIIILHFLLTAHFLITIVLIISTLTLAVEIGSNKKSGIEITNENIKWFSGNLKGQIDITDISSIEFKKKLDFSNRVRIIGKNNKKVTLPSEALPKVRLLKKTLEFYGVKLIDTKFND